MDGVLNVLKPAGMTSFDVIACLRRIYGQKKIGHGGTLDPMAAGVLPVFLGRSARLIEYAPIHRKTYEAEFVMGLATDTEDMTGRIIKTGKVCSDISLWERVASKFTGIIEQIPSSYSAIMVDGKRAYQLARNGKQVILPSRKVEVYHLQIREIQSPYIRLSVTCSAGTYVRALGRDLGNKMGVPLAMSFLLRTKMGVISIGQAKTLEEIERNPKDCLMTDISLLLSNLENVSLSEDAAKDFLQGKRLRTALPDMEVTAVFQGERFLGTAFIENGVLHPKKVFS